MFRSRAEAEEAGWFSRRHKTAEAHRNARTIREQRKEEKALLAHMQSKKTAERFAKDPAAAKAAADRKNAAKRAKKAKRMQLGLRWK